MVKQSNHPLTSYKAKLPLDGLKTETENRHKRFSVNCWKIQPFNPFLLVPNWYKLVQTTKRMSTSFHTIHIHQNKDKCPWDVKLHQLKGIFLQNTLKFNQKKALHQQPVYLRASGQQKQKRIYRSVNWKLPTWLKTSQNFSWVSLEEPHSISIMLLWSTTRSVFPCEGQVRPFSTWLRPLLQLEHVISRQREPVVWAAILVLSLQTENDVVWRSKT